MILCHYGTTHQPPPDLQRGDVISIGGKPWALIRRDGGFDGAAAVFKPHSPFRKVRNRDHQRRFSSLAVDPENRWRTEQVLKIDGPAVHARH